MSLPKFSTLGTKVDFLGMQFTQIYGNGKKEKDLIPIPTRRLVVQIEHQAS